MKRLLLLLGLLSCQPTAAQEGVLLIVADDLGAVDLEQLSAAGLTPSLDSLAAHGVRFTRAFGAPVCTPAREALFYGRWGTVGYGTCPDPGPDMKSMAAFWDGPSAFFGKWHLAGSCGAYGAGFIWRAGSCISITYPSSPPFPTTWERWDACVTSEDPSYPPLTIVAEAIDWWGEEPKGEILTVVAGPLPHQPFHAPPAELLPSGYPPGGYPPAGFARRRTQYEAMIVALDTLIGSLLEKVDLKKTTVIFCSDNGTPELVAAVGSKAKGTTFERGIRVPLIVAGPLVENPGRVSDALVSLTDLYATVIGSAQDGLTLEPILADEDDSIRDFIFAGYAADVCARSENFKLRRVGVEEQFFDLVDDPSETVNLIADKKLAKEIHAHRAWLDENLP